MFPAAVPTTAGGLAGRPRVQQLRRGTGADGAVGQPGQEEVDEGGPVQQDDRAAEPLGRDGAVRTGEPAAARGTYAALALPGGEGPHLVAQAHDVQGTLGVGGEGDAYPDGFQGSRALQDRDPPAAVVQGHRRGEAADSTADDDGVGLVHDSSSNPRTPVLRSSGKPEIRDPEHRNYTRSDRFTVLRM